MRTTPRPSWHWKPWSRAVLGKPTGTAALLWQFELPENLPRPQHLAGHGQAEVDDLHLPADLFGLSAPRWNSAHQYIGWLDVSMQDALAVSSMQSAGEEPRQGG